MTSRYSTGLALILACVTTVMAGCGSGTPTGPTNLGSNGGGGVPIPIPTPPPPPATATLRVTVDSACSTRESNITVYIDGSYAGITQPGASGVSQTVSMGDHTISATGDRGTRWAPTTRNVSTGGVVLNLTCSSTPPPSQTTTATLRVQVDANCTSKAANIEVSIDGLSAGTTQPGSSGISKVVDVGNHTVFAKASNGTTWPTFSVAVPAGGYLSNLTCR